MPPHTEPYWWIAAPRPADPLTPHTGKTDVAIVGSGMTGLVAALYLARGGRAVTIFDRGAPGVGASTRNAGYVGRSLKHGFGELLAEHGLDHAVSVYREMKEASETVAALIKDEDIRCDLSVQGRFIMAASPGQLDALKTEFDLRARHLGEAYRPFERKDQHREIATELYHGGVLIEDMAGLHPGLYHQGLLERALAAGVAVRPHTEVLSVTSAKTGFEIKTSRGNVAARDVVIATNGYTGNAVPWLRKRVVPFDAYMAATEPISARLIDEVLPAKRLFIDWNFNVDFARPSPDNTRILFGGNTGAICTDLPRMAEALRRKLVRMLPQLGDVRVSHVWTGRCAGTRDFYPHMGCEQGIHYALGYCFVGIPGGTYCGQYLARKILGQAVKPSAFWQRPFATIPMIARNPWFVPLATKWYARRDWR